MALRTEFAAALSQAATERGLDPEEILKIIQDAIKAAYRKDFGGTVEDLEVELDPETGEARVLREGEDITPPGFGRIGAQTAKQVLLQRIREAEKGAILSEFERRVGSVINGMIQRFEGPNIVVNLGKAEGMMPSQEQTPGENYRLNQRLRFYIVGIKESARGQDIIVSRAHKGLVEGLFKVEVPEIGSGIVEIKAISREAGTRTKVAVASKQAGVDPVGSCVGQKGVRVQAVIAELGTEKVDIIQWSEDPKKFIAAALSPAKVDNVETDQKEKTAHVEVPEDQLSLAIGKEGQNVRLAAKLSGWRIDIKGAENVLAREPEEENPEETKEESVAEKKATKKTTRKKTKKEETKIEGKKKSKKKVPGKLKIDEK
ncbi:MAG: transcription termination factor NusA [Patescibacteria group bacterium]|nr:transcription termination factor NusA [Patescibacteria group bacterium]